MHAGEHEARLIENDGRSPSQSMVDARVLAPRALRIVAVAGATREVGTTTIATHLATLAHDAGQNVLLIDGHLGSPDVERLLAVRPKHRIDEVASGAVLAGDAIAMAPSGVWLLGGGVRRAPIGDDAKLGLVSALEEIEDRFDLVVVDAGAGLNDTVRFFVGAATEAILVVDDQPCASDRVLAKALSRGLGGDGLRVVVNRAKGAPQASAAFDRLVGHDDVEVVARVRFLGAIPRDESLRRAGARLRDASTSVGARAMRRIARTLEGDAIVRAPSGGVKFMWRRLLREAETARHTWMPPLRAAV